MKSEDRPAVVVFGNVQFLVCGEPFHSDQVVEAAT